MSEEKKETVSEIIDFMEEFGGNVEKEYAKRLRKALELKGNNINDERELVTELWRSGKNIGARFLFKNKDIMWQDMTLDQRQEVVVNMAQMAQFFSGFLNQTRKDVK